RKLFFRGAKVGYRRNRSIAVYQIECEPAPREITWGEQFEQASYLSAVVGAPPSRLIVVLEPHEQAPINDCSRGRIARQEPLCFVSCFTIAEKERPCNVVAAQHVAHSRISFEALSASELTGSQAESPEFEHLFCALGPTGRVQFITDRGRQQLRSEAVARGRGERL